LTTEEILPALAALPSLRGEQEERLRLFLLHTDQVKFADYTPSEEEIQQTYDGGLEFVEATRPGLDASQEEPAQSLPREDDGSEDETAEAAA